ncbi:neuropeptide S receptor-like [Mizuhopecten yessoensis]|uniref:[Arg8]-vasotocin receptor n=1 Tax=Mizuhopecten yessoensis TaxID=6573 RepID=A0A210QQP3_MIZYE|nr:neuropeptide S receptor-like [Mizuhopecten yessoensis]OWF51052.1 [Arg8]-vasotocin receptor [Mizuhopecten yessoensis]
MTSTTAGFEQVTTNISEPVSDSPDVWTPEIVTTVTTVMFILVVTLVGNGLMIVLLLWKRSRRVKRVNIFMTNLAIGDLAVACITMTTEILFVAFGEWVLGPVLCKLTVYLQVVTLASATFLLTGMSIDRYQVIVRPMQSLANRPKIWTKVALAWTLALIFAVPQLFIFKEERVTRSDGSTKLKCLSHGYDHPWQRKLYFTFFSSYVLLVPSVLMFYCYYNIAKVVWSRGSSIRGRNSSPRMSGKRNLISASRMRVVTMTLTVIIGFLVCMMPYFAISLIRIYSDYKFQLKQALKVSEIIFMVHSAVNPVFYAIFTMHQCRCNTLSCPCRQKKTKLKTTSGPGSKCCNYMATFQSSGSYGNKVIIAKHSMNAEKSRTKKDTRHSTIIIPRAYVRETKVNYRFEIGINVEERKGSDPNMDYCYVECTDSASFI